MGDQSSASRVLAVDDDASVLVALRYALGDRFALSTAGSGAEALDVLAREEVAVLLVDQRMPGMTGVELCVKARALRPELVTMLITAYADVRSVIDAINLGQVSAYVQKPWSEVQLVAALEAALERATLARLLRERGEALVSEVLAQAVPLARGQLARELTEPLSTCERKLRELGTLVAAPDSTLGESGGEGDEARLVVSERVGAALELLDRARRLIDANEGRRSVLTWGPFRVDLLSSKVWVNETRVSGLEPRPVRVLGHLVEHATRACPRSELLNAVFDVTTPAVRTKALDRAISRLRAAVDDVDEEAAKLIVTVDGVGYGLGVDDKGRPIEGTNL